MELVLFGVPAECGASDVENMLKEAHCPCVRARLNGKHTAAFALFGSADELESAWSMARKHKFVMNGKCLRAVAKDEVVQTQLELENARIVEAFENPALPFVKLLHGYRAEKEFPALLAPPKEPSRDRTVFVRAWKTLLFEECRAQMDSPVTKSSERYKIKRMTGGTIDVSYREHQEELLPCDVVLIGDSLGMVEKSDKSTVTVKFEGAAPAGEQSVLVLVCSLLTARRAYDALNWFHVAPSSGNPVLSCLFQGGVSKFSPLAAPRAPSHLNEAQARVVSRFALLDEGVIMCQGVSNMRKKLHRMLNFFFFFFASLLELGKLHWRSLRLRQLLHQTRELQFALLQTRPCKRF